MNEARQRVLRSLYPVYRPLLSALGELDAIARIHRTDKSAHGYTRRYRKHFGRLRRRRISLLEIGIGGWKDPASGGESLRMWRDYFPYGSIHAIDLYDKSGLDEERIKTLQGSQADPAFLREVAERYGPFDIVIDDGSHVSQHVITSFEALFPHVKEGGYYVVEDLFFSYDPALGGSSVDLASPTTSMGYLKNLADHLQHRYLRSTPRPAESHRVGELHFYPKICFVVKGDNLSPDEAVERYYRAQQETQAADAPG